MKRIVSAGAVLVVLTAAASSRSDTSEPSRALDLVDRSLRWVERGAHGGDESAAKESDVARQHPSTSAPLIALKPHEATATREKEEPSVRGTKSKPRLHGSLIARDWKGAYTLAGDQSLPTDNIRMTRSSRMIVARIAAGDGAIVPFAHIGVGEWRYDLDMLPLLPRNQEYATQFSAGVEMRLAKQVSLAWEADYTVLCREKREPQNLPTPFVLGAVAVLEMRF